MGHKGKEELRIGACAAGVPLLLRVVVHWSATLRAAVSLPHTTSRLGHRQGTGQMPMEHRVEDMAVAGAAGGLASLQTE